MVELEASELPEDVMLGAVMFGQKGFQPVIDAIIKLAEVAAKEPRDFDPEDLSALEAEMLGVAEAELRDAYKITDKAARYDAVDAVKAKVVGALPAGGCRGTRIQRRTGRRRVQVAAGQDRALEHPRYRKPHRRTRPQDRPSDRGRSRPSAAHPRFGAVHPR